MTAVPAAGGVPGEPEDCPFPVLGLVARGGMGEIWQVRHPGLESPVVMKVLRSDMAGDPDVKARFEREARLVSRMRLPHLVPVHDQGILPDGRPYILMDLVEGESLLDAIHTLHSLSSRDAWHAGEGHRSLRGLVEALLRVALTVGHAHRMGVVHRDIKPPNIMLDRWGEVFLMDWGVARTGAAPAGAAEPPAEPRGDQGGLTTWGAAPGTPCYMAPEQVRDPQGAGPQVDVYGLGATLYHVLAGRPPFGDLPPEVVLERLRQGHVPSLEGHQGPPVPEGLARVLVRATAPDPGSRYPSAEDMARDLETWLAGTEEIRTARGRWEAAARAPRALWPQDRVEDLRVLADRAGPSLDPADRAFVEASRRRASDLARARLRRRRLVAVSVAAAALAITAGAAWNARVGQLRRVAELASRAAQARIAQRPDRALALLRAQAQVLGDDRLSPEDVESLARAGALAVDLPFRALAAPPLPDGFRLVLQDDARHLSVLDVSASQGGVGADQAPVPLSLDGETRLHLGGTPVRAVCSNSDSASMGGTLLVESVEGRACAVRPTNLEVLGCGRLPFPSSQPCWVSDRGQVSYLEQGTAWLWPPGSPGGDGEEGVFRLGPTPQRPFFVEGEPMVWLVAEGSVERWRLDGETPARLPPLPLPPGDLVTGEDPDPVRVYLGQGAGRVVALDVRDGRQDVLEGCHDQAVSCVSSSPEGTLYTVSPDRRLCVGPPLRSGGPGWVPVPREGRLPARVYSATGFRTGDRVGLHWGEPAFWLVDGATGQVLQRLWGFDSEMGLRADSGRDVAVSHRGGTRIVRTRGDPLRARVDLGSSVRRLAWREGSVLTRTRSGDLLVLDPSGRERARFQGPTRDAWWDSQGILVLEGDRIWEWDPDTLARRPVARGARGRSLARLEGQVVFADDRGLLLADPQGPGPARQLPLAGWGLEDAESLGFALDPATGSLLVQGDQDVWRVELPSGQVCRREGQGTERVTFASSRAVMGWRDGTVEWMDPGECQATTRTRAHGDLVADLAVSPDGTLLAAGGWDHAVTLWSVPHGTLVARLEGHTRDVMDLDFSDDGSLLASASDDGTVGLWSIPADHPERAFILRFLEGHDAPVTHVSFGPGGRDLASADWNGVLDFWDLDPLALVPEPTGLEDLGRLTSLRVCPGDLSVVPVPPPVDPASVWAPEQVCPR